jgi:hypothetical protein
MQNEGTFAMKKILSLAVLVTVVVFVPLVCYPASRTVPFRVHVVDERTGAGIPDARVTLENAAVAATAFDGSVLFWLDVGLTKRPAHFTVEDRGVTTSVDVRVTPGGVVWIAVPAP